MEKLVFGLMLVSSVLLSCTNEEALEMTDDGYRRTVVVYLGRDSKSLSGGGENKLRYMLDGWNGKGGHLVVYQDTAHYEGSVRQGSNASLMEVVPGKGGNTVKTIEQYGEENSADPEVFKRVLDDAVRMYPADSYGLVVFSHGYGWLPSSSALRSIIVDQDEEMDVKDLADAIPEGKFGYVIFEACFSAGIELAYELKDKVDYVFGSSAEIVSPGYLYVYGTSMNYLFGRRPALETFARQVYQNVSTSAAHFNSGTFSLIKTSELPRLSSFIRANARRDTVVDPSDIQDFGRYQMRNIFFDFEDYYSRLMKDDAARHELSEIVSQCVPYKEATPTYLVGYGGFYVNRHSGLTTYIEQEQYPWLNGEYEKLRWYEATH